MEKNNADSNLDKIGAVLKHACDRRFGPLDQSFLCQSLSVLNPHSPYCVGESDTLADVLELFKAKRVGCVLIAGVDKKLIGIFSERDLILKVDLRDPANLKRQVSELMTREPVTTNFDTTLAFALNLMSNGGFRHLPIVDHEGVAVGLISVKDVVDHIVSSFLKDLMEFELPEGLDL